MVDPDALIHLVDTIVRHYRSLGGYGFVPNDHQDCIGNPKCTWLGNMAMGAGYYRVSLTIDSMVNSTLDGRVLALPSAGPASGLYWIRESQGYGNARIVAHIMSDDGGTNPHAVVAAT